MLKQFKQISRYLSLLIFASSLVACGGGGGGSTTNNIINNTQPIANAGTNITALPGTTIFLDGSNSTDADGDLLAYQWDIIKAPAGSSSIIINPTTSAPSITPDLDGYYVISLFVSDGISWSDADLISVSSFTNNPPLANAGVDQAVSNGITVMLDGSNSFDADGDLLTYKWEFLSVPAGSSVMLLDSTTLNPSFTPDINGSYNIMLTVNDGIVDSEPHTVIITAVDATPPAFVFHYLYGGFDNATYLGCLNCDSFNSESVCNDFGSYGSAFATNSIWNQFGTYGSKFNTYSPWNSFSSSGPAIIGSDGLFYGYFTTNSFKFDRTLITGYVNVLDYFTVASDLAATRTFACD